MKEILDDQINGVDDDGNVVPLDFAVWSDEDTLYQNPDERVIEPHEPIRERVERLRAVNDVYGFLPHTLKELNYATSALDYASSQGGFARVLNNVLRHQIKHMSGDSEEDTANNDQSDQSKDPKNAVRSITTKIIEYAKEARADTFMLQQLNNELGGETPQNKLLANSHRIADWQTQDTTRRGLQLLARHVQTAGMLRDMDEGYEGAIKAALETPAIELMMKTVSVGSAKRLIGVAIEQETARSQFWLDCVQQALKHTVAKSLAARALEELMPAQ